MKRKHCTGLLGWLLLLLVCVAVGSVFGATQPILAQDLSPSPAANSSPTPTSDAQTYNPHTVQRPLDDRTYRVGPGDILRVTVWDEPQLQTRAIVRPDGKISMPLLADVPVAGLTPEEAQRVLTDQLAHFVKRPRVNVIVEEIQSRIVYITGEVQHPGAYPLISAISVSQLIARAGGTTEFAHKRQVFVMRPETGQRLKVDYERILSGKKTEQNIALLPGDTVVIP